ncbi:hypothetical protein [Clostridium sp. VAP23]|uniref:hypothetical protein n=1 Tax=Clostridium sp. VAP23 TaxID=2949981 RepID=UPI002079AE3D|nr:hypothetical protein [Clostridium sp. VAP23]
MQLLKKDKSNKKNINYIPLNFEENLIKTNGEFSKVIKIDDLDEIKRILQITNYRNRYKLFLDIKNVGEVEYYLVETVIANTINEADEKFKTEDEISSEKLIRILRDFYQKGSFNESFDYEEIDIRNPRKEIAPINLSFKENYFITDKYVGIVNAAQNLNNDYFDLESIINKVQFRTLISIDFKRVNEEKILRYLENSLETEFKSQPEIPEELRDNIPKIRERVEYAVNNKIGLLLYGFTIIQLGENLENTNKYNEQLKKLLKFNGMSTITLNNNQRNGLNYTLPYGIDNNDIKLLLEEDKFLNILNK